MNQCCSYVKAACRKGGEFFSFKKDEMLDRERKNSHTSQSKSIQWHYYCRRLKIPKNYFSFFEYMHDISKMPSKKWYLCGLKHTNGIYQHSWQDSRVKMLPNSISKNYSKPTSTLSDNSKS